MNNQDEMGQELFSTCKVWRIIIVVKNPNLLVFKPEHVPIPKVVSALTWSFNYEFGVFDAVNYAYFRMHN